MRQLCLRNREPISNTLRVSSLLVLLAITLLVLTAGSKAQAQWLSSNALSDSGTNALQSDLASDGSGANIVAWRQSDGTNMRIHVSVRLNGLQGFNTQLLSDSGQDAAYPKVASNLNGDLAIAWIRSDGANQRVQVVTGSTEDGGTYSSPIDLSDAGSDAAAPQVAVDDNGNTVVTWQRSDGTNTRIQAVVISDNGTVGSVTTLSDSGQNATDPQVEVDDNGMAIVVWQRLDGSKVRVQSRTVTLSNGLLGSVATLSDAGQDATAPHVTAYGNGNAVAVWKRSDGSRFRIQAASLTAAGWGAAENLSASGQQAAEAQVASNSSGQIVAIWRRFDGSNPRVQAVTGVGSEIGITWSVAQTLSDSGQPAREPHVAVNEGGKALASWYRTDGVNRRTQGAAMENFGSWEAVETLSTGGSDVLEPNVAVDSEGNGMALWAQFDGSAWRLHYSGYDAVGPQASSIDIPESGVVGEDLTFAVSPVDIWAEPSTVDWDFGSDTATNSSTVVYQYAEAGTYTVTATMTDALGKNRTVSRSVVVEEAPVSTEPEKTVDGTTETTTTTTATTTPTVTVPTTTGSGSGGDTPTSLTVPEGSSSGTQDPPVSTAAKPVKRIAVSKKGLRFSTGVVKSSRSGRPLSFGLFSPVWISCQPGSCISAKLSAKLVLRNKRGKLVKSYWLKRIGVKKVGSSWQQVNYRMLGVKYSRLVKKISRLTKSSSYRLYVKFKLKARDGSGRLVRDSKGRLHTTKTVRLRKTR